jgi:hypothetical protein
MMKNHLFTAKDLFEKPSKDPGPEGPAFLCPLQGGLKALGYR